MDIKDIATKLLLDDKKTQESMERIQAARLRVAEAQVLPMAPLCQGYILSGYLFLCRSASPM